MRTINQDHPAVETRKVLKKIFGNMVSVTRDRGTAAGWVKAGVTTERPENCECTPGSMYCEACREKMREINQKVNEAVKNVEFYTYCDDMGDDRREFLLDVHFK